MAHIPHLFEYLFHEKKMGGWIAAGCAIAAFVVLAYAHPFIIDVPDCSKQAISCPQEFKLETLVTNLIGALIAGGVGVAIAMVLVDLGVSKDTLGIDE